jgi:hypothetical protein
MLGQAKCSGRTTRGSHLHRACSLICRFSASRCANAAPGIVWRERPTQDAGGWRQGDAIARVFTLDTY